MSVCVNRSDRELEKDLMECMPDYVVGVCLSHINILADCARKQLRYRNSKLGSPRSRSSLRTWGS